MNYLQNGHAQAITSFIVWGLVPLYWHLLHDIPAYLNTSLRIVFTVITLNVIFHPKKQGRDFLRVLKDKKLFLKLCFTSVLIISNWLVFLISFQRGMVWQASLGYFLSPIFNVLLSVIFFKEKLSTPLKVATLFIFLAIINMVGNLGSLPWISLFLALSFSIYALIKKGVKISPESSLNMEVMLILPFALYFIFDELPSHPLSAFQWGVMSLSGFITFVPLALYNASAQKIPFSHLALYQYIAPSLQFLVAVIIFREHLETFHFLSFFLIWCGLLVFTWERVMTRNRNKGIIS
ncbi:MAG: EamA family transporter RarD [Bacteriovoracaceae bacterium]|nr:EamA family transporter RarD [Bacteriovoracaceae bacterium]